jgi:FG-GAP-like repeat
MSRERLIAFAAWLAWLLVFLASPVLARLVTFAPAVPYASGTAPRAVAVADFNGDGAPDLAVANSGDGAVSVLPALGGGTFIAGAATLMTGAGPSALAAMDLNNDGHPDLVVANQLAGTVSVFIESGVGFQFNAATPLVLSCPTTIPCTPAPVALAIGQFDGAGGPDLAVVDQGGNAIDIFLGNGDGTFVLANQLIFQPHPTAIDVGDLDNNGKLDLVLARGDGTAAIFLNPGDGSLLRGFGAIGVLGAPTGVAAGDVTGDLKTDLVVSGGGTDGRVALLVGKGDGTFQPPVRLAVGNNPQAVGIDDFDKDGLLDLATANRDDDSVTLLRGAGGAAFAPPQVFAVGHKPVALVVADLDGDGYPDLVTANSDDGNVSVLMNLTGMVTPPPTATPPVGPQIAADDATAVAGDSTAVAVSLQSGNGVVVGVQNEIRFDPSRLSLTPADCSVNPIIGESLTVGIHVEDAQHAVLRAVVLSLQSLDPIPDGELYRCTFAVLSGTLPEKYQLHVTGAMASDAVGNAIAGLTTRDGSINVLAPDTISSVTPTLTPTATRSATPTSTPVASPSPSPSPTEMATVSHTPPPTMPPTIVPTVTAAPEPTTTPMPTTSTAQTVTATVSASSCVGDCDGNNVVTVEELVRAVDITLGATSLPCARIDRDQNGRVTIDELVTAVGNAIDGCQP